MVATFKARGVGLAVHEAHQQGCNPGGEVAIVAAPDGLVIPEMYMNRLLTRDEITECDKAVGTL